MTAQSQEPAKVHVDLQMLKNLADIALTSDYGQDSFIGIALQWAEGANAEINRLREENRLLKLKRGEDVQEQTRQEIVGL